MSDKPEVMTPTMEQLERWAKRDHALHDPTITSCDCYLCQCAATARMVINMRSMLMRLQWCNVSHCPVCDYYEQGNPKGHAPDCELAALLGENTT